MLHVVLVHGRGKTYEIPDKFYPDWEAALRFGLRTFSVPFHDKIPMRFSFYGDVWRPDRQDEEAERGEERGETATLQVQLASELAQLNGLQPQADPEAERLGWADINRLLGVLDTHFGIGEWVLKTFLKDLAQYYTDEGFRNRTLDRVEEQIRAAKGNDVVLMAHSMGSIVSYDLLTRRPDLPVPALITFGSPLGMPSFHKYVRDTQGETRFPPRLAQWINIYTPEDFATAIPELAPLFPALDGDPRKVDDRQAEGQTPKLTHIDLGHDPETYLSSRTMAEALRDVVERWSAGRGLGDVRRPDFESNLEDTAPDPEVVEPDEVGGRDTPFPDPPTPDFEASIEDGGERSYVEPEADDGLERENGGGTRSAGTRNGNGGGGGGTTEAAQPEVRAIERTASADFPQAVEPGSENVLSFAIGKQAIYRFTAPLMRLDVPENVEKLDLVVHVRAAGFAVLDPTTGNTKNQANVTLSLVDDDAQVRGMFLLRAGQAAMETNIYLDFWHEGTPAGQITIPTRIGADRAAAGPAPGAGSSRTGTLGISLGKDRAPDPDLVFTITALPEGKYEIEVSREGQYFGKKLGEFPTTSNAWAYAQSLLDRFRSARELTNEERVTRVDGLGLDLWWNLPELFRDYYWDEMHGQDLSIAVYSQEPYIPWELIKPQRESGGETADMLGVAFPIARWKQARLFPNPLVVSGFSVVAPDYTTNPLVNTKLEAEELAEKFGAQPVLGMYSNVTQLLKSGGVQVIHFAGHGKFDPSEPNKSVIQLTDNPLQPSDLRTATIRRSDRPMVFLNACEVGDQGWLLTQIGGWADAFCDVGFSAFVGPYWAVNDRVAKKASLLFYDHLKGGLTLGMAMREIRRRFWTDDEHRYHPTWLAYSLHCQPNVSVKFAQ